jgi:hypothetical protein
LVVACNAAAEACGVRLEMPLAEAAVLAERGQSSKFKVQGSKFVVHLQLIAFKW